MEHAEPLIVGVERGFFEAEGLEVRLSREVSWATVRDKVAAGALDGEVAFLAGEVSKATLFRGGVATIIERLSA